MGGRGRVRRRSMIDCDLDIENGIWRIVEGVWGIPAMYFYRGLSSRMHVPINLVALHQMYGF